MKAFHSVMLLLQRESSRYKPINSKTAQRKTNKYDIMHYPCVVFPLIYIANDIANRSFFICFCLYKKFNKHLF